MLSPASMDNNLVPCLRGLDSLKETAREDLIQFVIHRIDARAVELKYELHDLYTSERTGPHSWRSQPLQGVDGYAVMRAMGTLAVLEFGFVRVRLKKPPYPVKFDDFVAAASKVIDDAESCLIQQHK